MFKILFGLDHCKYLIVKCKRYNSISRWFNFRVFRARGCARNQTQAKIRHNISYRSKTTARIYVHAKNDNCYICAEISPREIKMIPQ
jgi:hypothetical protein